MAKEYFMGIDMGESNIIDIRKAMIKTQSNVILPKDENDNQIVVAVNRLAEAIENHNRMTLLRELGQLKNIRTD